MINLILADGFEEIEAVATIDILRRCGLEAQTVSIVGRRLIRGAHGIPVMADALNRYNEMAQCDAIVLPGGMPGAQNLAASEALRKSLLLLSQHDKVIAAICAAPMVLGQIGLLEGRRATCYPGFEEQLAGAEVTGAMVEEDGPFITAKGPAAAVDFAFAVAARFVAGEVIEQARRAMLL